MAEIGPRRKDRCLSSDEEDDDAPADIEPSLPQLNTFREDIEYLEDVRLFLEMKGHTTEATKTSDLGNILAQLVQDTQFNWALRAIYVHVLQIVRSMIIKLLIHHPIL